MVTLVVVRLRGTCLRWRRVFHEKIRGKLELVVWVRASLPAVQHTRQLCDRADADPHHSTRPSRLAQAVLVSLPES
jgi:hypothetical protein